MARCKDCKNYRQGLPKGFCRQKEITTSSDIHVVDCREFKPRRG